MRGGRQPAQAQVVFWFLILVLLGIAIGLLWPFAYPVV